MAKKYTADIIEATSITGSLLGTATLASALVPGNKTVEGDLTVTGKITAEEFYTELVSSSIVYKSGSTKFGDSSDDVMSVTGSLRVQGSITGSVFGTATNAVSSSYAVTSSYAHFAATPTVQGVQGTQGIQGVGGSIGGQGTQGATGAQGITGIQGLQGRQGTTGIQGTNGSNGAQGTQGIQGTAGSNGAQGIQGIQGTAGSNGSQGTQGIQGTTGAQGIQGIQGVQGPNAGITSYTNAADNRVITSVNSSTINAEANLTFDGSTLGVTGAGTFSSGITASKSAKNTYGIQIKGGYYGAPRLQLYDLAIDTNAFVGLGVDMSGAAYEFSNYFPRTGGNGKWSVGSWAGDFGSGQYVSGYNEKLWINESAAQFNVTLTNTVDLRAPIFYDSNNTGYYVDPASTSNLYGLTVNQTISGNISGNAATATTAGNVSISNLNTQQVNVSLAGGAWYTIAANAGDRASAKFTITDPTSGLHQAIHFYASAHFGTLTGAKISVLSNTYYSGPPITAIRTMIGSTYDGAMVQVYANSSCTITVSIADNQQVNGWVIRSGVVSSTNPGVVANYGALSTTGAYVETSGGRSFSISDDIYIGGRTTQYLGLHTNNYNSYAPTLTGGNASGNWGINITGNAATSTTATNLSGFDKVNPTFGSLTATSKPHYFGASSSWDGVGFSSQTNVHFQGHANFWIGAGNAYWYRGGLATEHDLLITTMYGYDTRSYYRGITFAVDNTGAGNSGYRLGRWVSYGTEWRNSRLHVDGSLIVGYGARGTQQSDVADWPRDYGLWSHGRDEAGYGNDRQRNILFSPSANGGGPWGSFNSLEVSSTNDGNADIPALLRIHQWGSGAAEFWKPNGQVLYLRESPSGGSITHNSWFTRFHVQKEIYSTGDIVAYASDKRLKENYEPLTDAVFRVQKLTGMTFDWKDGLEELGFTPNCKHEIGVLAQDVQLVLPEAVKLAPFDDNGKGESISGENYLTVRYEKIVPLLIEAIKEQQTQIENQQSQIDELKALVKTLVG